jgi:myo-inositol-1(or 4)-monophosphatase
MMMSLGYEQQNMSPAVRTEEAQEDARPLLIPVVTGIGPGVDALWLGNLTAAEDASALYEAGITASLNLAINIFPLPLSLPDGTQVRRYQIGMLDGLGNAPQTLAAAVLLIDGLVANYTQGKPHYPRHRNGGLLVHCRGGRSRSVTVLALWLHLRFTSQYPSLDAALAHLRSVRGLTDTYPLPPMIALAQEALALNPLQK